MPAGDGATVERTDLSCGWCGADLSGSTTERLGEWTAYTCHKCEVEARSDVPASGAVRAFPRVETVEEGST